MGFDESSLRWFQNYLTLRKQVTVINNTFSTYNSVTCGIPQGSILGPLLFILFINDISDVIKFSSISMYADDIIHYSSDNVFDFFALV